MSCALARNTSRPHNQRMDLPSRDQLAALIATLGQGLLERGTAIRLTLLAALAGEHVLLIGPPGSAKSELARRLVKAFRGAHAFERLLTRFSVPEELFGPLSLSALEQDRYERITAGYLPHAEIAFLDEVFKANSAILNSLLTLLNEREFDNGTRREKVPLISLIGASNEVPDDSVLEALFDRFLLRLFVRPVSDAAFASLITLPQRAEHSSGADATQQLDRSVCGTINAHAAGVTLSHDAAELLSRLREAARNAHVAVSDRRWVKIVHLLRVAAVTEGRSTIDLWDVWLATHCMGRTADEQAALRDVLAQHLGTLKAFTAERFAHAVVAFEAQLTLEASATETSLDDAGKLSLTGDRLAQAELQGAPRLTSAVNRRRYGPLHVNARLAQCDELLAHIDQYLPALNERIAQLSTRRTTSVWLDDAFLEHAHSVLLESQRHVAALRERVVATKNGFAALPRLEAAANEAAPAPIEV